MEHEIRKVEQRRVNLEDITLILFVDEHNLKLINEEFEDELRRINDFLLLYTNESLLLDYIKSVKLETIVLIVYLSDEEIHELMKSIYSCEKTSIECIIFVTDNTDLKFADCATTTYVCHSKKHLIDMLKENIHMIRKQLANTTYDSNMNQKFIRQLPKESGTFLYLHLFKDVLLSMDDELKAKCSMIEQCRLYYANNKTQLGYIDRFETEYRNDDAIRWYTKDCFLYRLINKALRTEDIEQLFLFRFYIADLCQHLQLLKKEQEKSFQSSHSNICVAYRGTLQSSENLEVIRSNVGNTIAFNGFLSVSHSEHIASIFAGAHITQRRNAHSIIFQIHIDMSLPDIIVADISHLSEHPEEKEILFDIGTTFRIESLFHDEARDLWQCKLNTTEEGVLFARDHILLNTNIMQGMRPDIRFASLLIDMCAYSTAEHYLQTLLKDSNRSDIAHIYLHLGRNHDSRKYDVVIKYLHTAMQFESNPIFIASIMRQIGIQIYQRSNYVSQSDYDEAISWNEKALKLYNENDCSQSIGAAYCLNNMGFGLYKLGRLNEALEMHKRALEIRQKILPRDHPHIAQSFRNIGMIYLELDHYETALDYQFRALNIVECTVPDDHWSRGNTFRNFGCVYHRQGDFVRACESYEKALQIYRRTFSFDHPDIIRTCRLLEYARNGAKLHATW